jgi:hypothetical protein
MSPGNVAGSGTDHNRSANGHLKRLDDFRDAANVQNDQRILMVETGSTHQVTRTVGLGWPSGEIKAASAIAS